MWTYTHTDELKHYGVLGMKWGVRRYQNKDGTLKAAGRKQYGGDERAGSIKEKPNSENSQKKGLTDKQKKAIKIGAAVALSVLAVYGGYKISKHIKGKDLKNKLRDINPLHTNDIFSENWKGTNMNCGQTTIAEELVMRGEKVHAKLNETGMYPEHFGSYFNGMHEGSISRLDLGPLGDAKTLFDSPIDPKRGKHVEKAIKDHVLKTFPKGSRGSIYVPNINGNHFISFENVKGRVRLDNPQAPDVNLEEFFKGAVSKGTSGADKYGIRFTRLDDLKINRDAIKEVVTSNRLDNSADFNSQIIRGSNFVMNMH